MHRYLLSTLLILVMALGCATTGPGNKKSLILIPTSQEVAIGQGMAQQLSETEKELPDQVWQDYLDEVGQRVVAVCDRKDIEYHFTVIESDQINAFAAPGGYIYFYTGLLKQMDNEGEMAAVVAHEISHVVARHGIKRVQAAMGVALAYELVFGSDGASDALNAAIGIGLNLAFSGYSRENEREADAYGIHYMVQAGYNPECAVTMYEKLAALGGGGDRDVFEQLAATHPETTERIQNANQAIADMQPLPPTLDTGAARYLEMRKRLP